MGPVETVELGIEVAVVKVVVMELVVVLVGPVLVAAVGVEQVIQV